LKSNFITGNRLQETGNQLPESKYSGNLEKFEKTLFVKQNCAMFGFGKIFFNTSLVKSWLVASWFLLLNLKFIFSWILILLDVFSLILKLILILNLLTQSWHHSFGIFVIIKTTWIILDSSSWSLLLQFWDWGLKWPDWKKTRDSIGELNWRGADLVSWNK